MSERITVTTASVPGREQLLAEAIASVNAQTSRPFAHLVRVQEPPGGQLSPLHLASQRNALLDAVETEWLAVLDDDDVYLPHHFETIAPHLDDADVVYTFARVGCVSRYDTNDVTTADLVARLRQGNCIPSNAAVRAETVRDVGGWSADGFDFDRRRYISTNATWEDWDMWLRLARAGATFRCVPNETWDYRSGDWDKATTSWGF